MIGMPGPMELVIILVIVLVIFGAGKLPMIGGNIGKAIKNFKSGIKEKEEEVAAAADKERIEEEPQAKQESK